MTGFVIVCRFFEQPRTRNVHPCAYDAYGMTVVEAAACGAASMLSTGAGARALLQEATLTVEMPQQDSHW
eukprot:Skav205804  [mRNA]  locus=scaffold307:224736:225239:- [translate_table: standard]